MTKGTTTERLRAVEVEIKGVKEDVHEVKDDIKDIKRLLERQDRKYVLKREAVAITGTLSFFIAFLGVYIAINQ